MIVHLATLTADQRPLVGWRLGFDLASVGVGMSAVLPIDLATKSIVRAFLQDVVKLAAVEKDMEDFILRKPALPVPIMLACALLSATKADLR